MDIPQRMGAVTLAAVVVFAATCTAAQCLRADLDWMQVPLSFYLIDDYGALVRAAYFVLAVGLAALGAGWYCAMSPGARSAAPLLLFAVAAVALCVTAVAHTNTAAQPSTWHGFVHGVAAQTTFLCTTVAMLLQGWRLRGDVRWRHRFVPAFAGAAACFAGLWVQALWRDVPRGLTQKLLIVMILAWLACAAWWLWRGGARTSGPGRRP